MEDTQESLSPALCSLQDYLKLGQMTVSIVQTLLGFWQAWCHDYFLGEPAPVTDYTPVKHLFIMPSLNFPATSFHVLESCYWSPGRRDQHLHLCWPLLRHPLSYVLPLIYSFHFLPNLWLPILPSLARPLQLTISTHLTTSWQELPPIRCSTLTT